MIDQAQTDKFKDILELSQNILIVFPDGADLDLFLATYCFYSFLLPQKSVRILSPKCIQKLPKALEKLIKTDELEHELGKENLLISFPYQEEQVDKVSYYIGEKDKRFYLTIKPKKNVAPLDSSKVEFAYAGAQADLLILCGVENLESLEQLYFAYETLYKGDNNYVVTINDFIPDFGKLNLDISPSSSYCEAMLYLLQDLDSKNEDVLAKSNLPSLLLYGIEAKTRGLQSANTDINTFLAVASLLKLGATRLFKLPALRPAVKRTSKLTRVLTHAVK